MNISELYSTLDPVLVLSTLDVKMAAVVVTDGSSGGGVDAVKDKTDILKHHGTEIFVVALGNEIKPKEIRAMASKPERGHVFLLKKGTDVDKLVSGLAREICKTKELPVKRAAHLN